MNPEIPLVVESGLFAGTLAAVLLSIHHGRPWRLLVLVLGVPAAVLWVLPTEGIPHTIRVVRHLLAIAFLAYAMLSILLLIFAHRQVTLNRALRLALRLLAGRHRVALAYSLIEASSPGSFYTTLPEGRLATLLRLDAGNAAETLYFSFTTLTTLGYGDIVPGSRLTRLLSALEALVGQLYLTVLVARLVGLHIAEVTNDDES